MNKDIKEFLDEIEEVMREMLATHARTELEKLHESDPAAYWESFCSALIGFMDDLGLPGPEYRLSQAEYLGLVQAISKVREDVGNW